MLENGTIITAQQKLGVPFSGEITDATKTTGGDVRYVVYVTDDAGKISLHKEPMLVYVYGSEIIPNAIDDDELIAQMRESAQ